MSKISAQPGRVRGSAAPRATSTDMKGRLRVAAPPRQGTRPESGRWSRWKALQSAGTSLVSDGIVGAGAGAFAGALGEAFASLTLVGAW